MIGSAQEIIGWLFQQERDKLFEIKEHRPKRSLTANAYAWALITEIANVLRMSKEDVYLRMLKDYGQSVTVTMRSDVDPSRYFKYYEPFRDGIAKGRKFTAYKVYVGSSEYDSREMAILIDGIVQEATNLGIPTITENEVKKLLQGWKHEVNPK